MSAASVAVAAVVGTVELVDLIAPAALLIAQAIDSFDSIPGLPECSVEPEREHLWLVVLLDLPCHQSAVVESVPDFLAGLKAVVIVEAIGLFDLCFVVLLPELVGLHLAFCYLLLEKPQYLFSSPIKNR